MKNFILFFCSIIAIFLLPQKVDAQGYIDCATILNDDADWINSSVAVKTINGYTYLYFTPWHYDPLTAGSLPVINGEDWHLGEPTDAYLAVVDPNCNQILGTYIGGSDYESGDIMDIDANGNIVITGYTSSADFPTTDGTTYSGTGNDVIFIQKYAADGTLIFSTLIGGSSGNSNIEDLIIDGTNIYLAGYTNSSDFPTTNGTTVSGSTDYVLLKYDGNGNLQYATVHGGSSTERDAQIDVVNGQAVLAGSARSSDFSSTDGSTYSGSLDDASLTIFDGTGNVVFSTIYGGDGNENAITEELFVLSDGAFIYIIGETSSTNFPTTDGSVHAGSNDIYFRKYDLAGNLLVSKLLGGTGSDSPKDVQIVNGSIYLMGQVWAGFPTTDGSTVNGTTDALIMSLDTDGNTNFATVYGGTTNDAVVGMHINSNGEIYLNINGTNARTTDGSSGYGTVFAKFNADGSLCAASTINNDPSGNYTTYYPEVINDTMYTFKHHYSSDAISTDGSVYAGNENYSVVKFVFCPPVPTGTTSTLTPSTINVCQNGLIDQIDGEAIMIDGSVFPEIYQGGGPQNQSDIELNYQWQSAISNTGPWSDIPGPLAQQQNFTPPPTATDLYYRRIATASECCGGASADISSVTAVLVTGDQAPTVDAGGVFFTCPGATIEIGGDTTTYGGTSPYSFSWEDGLYTTHNPSVTPSQSGVYTLEVTDANGCLQVDQATVTIYAADAGTDTDVCDGAATLIGGTPLAGVPIVPAGGSSTPGEFNVSYDWSPKDGTLSCTDCPNPTANPTLATTYTLTVTIHHPDGTTTCNSTDDVTVGVVSPPSGAITIEEAVLCLGETIELGTNLPPVSTATISTLTQTSAPTSNTATVANLIDGDFSTGGHTNDGTAESIILDFGSLQNINVIKLAALSGQTGDDRLFVDLSTDNVNWTTNVAGWSNWNSGISATELTVINFAAQDVRYVRLRSNNNFRDISISEFYAVYDYTYIWTPGDYISTSGGSAIFDPGNVDMPTPNPITYTVSATLGTCTWYEQVTVAVIEARAGEDNCGPRTIGEVDRTLNINETYSWTMITDPAITTGTGSFLGATDQVTTSVSASVGGDVGYELTTTYTLPGGATGTCKDTVIVIPTCGGPTCKIDVQDGGCPDFSDGETILTAIPENDGDPADWTYSWTSNEGMVGLNNYNSQEVILTDDVTRTYTVTMTSVLDPSYTCQSSQLVNDPSFSRPTINVTSPVTTCKGTPISIGDPANNPGLTYEWTNTNLLNNPTLSYPEATVNTTTEFIIKVTDNVTGCFVKDTVLVIVPTSSNAGPDFVVCDNGVATIGANTDTLGFTYEWSPAGADWRNGTDQFDPMPEVFVATTQQFILTATDTSGTCVSKDTINIMVENIPASFTLPDVDFCPSQGTLVLGNDDGTTGGTSQMPAGYEYLWSGGNVNDASLENPEVSLPLPTTSTTYTVKVSTPGGCNVVTTQTFNPLIAPPITTSSASVCIGEAHAIGDAANPATVTWTSNPDVNADLSTTTGGNPIFTPTSTGTFTFTATYTDTGCSSTAEVTITVQDATAPALSPVTICEGNTAQIGVANEPTLSYQWDPIIGLDDPYISNPTFTGTTSTNYTLTVVNGNGCAAEASTSVTVNPAPVFAGGIDYPDQEFCDPTTASAILSGTITPSGTYGYSWSPTAFLNDANIANPTLFLQGEGSYEYTLEVIDQATGCSVFETVIVTVGDGCGMGTIGNIVWLDENGDGIQDAGEPGIAGVTVELRDGSGNLVATTTTDANGGYLFTGLEDHTYTVNVQSGSLPSGLTPTYDENSGTVSPDQTTTVTITDSNEHMTADFGYNYTPPADTDTPTMVATGAIGDQIWNDANGDGVLDPGESGIENVTVTLYSDSDGDGIYDTPVGTATTDAAGNYIFDGLAPAAYVVEVDDTTLPAGFSTTPTGDPDGDADNTSEPVIVAPGDVVLTQDFAYQPIAGSTIGDLIFVDADGDGIQDASDPGIEGVTVALEDAAGNVIATTTTDANGNYSFPGLPAGTYDVVITDTDNVLGEVSPISDPDGGMDMTSNVTVDGTTDALTEDFGFAPDGHTAGDGMIGNTIYIDTNNDSALTTDEGVEGVTVELYAADGTTLVSTTTTDENGNYLFGGLDATAIYVVKVDETTLPGGAVYTNMDDPNAGTTSESTVDLSITAGINLDQDFGYAATVPVAISGSIWEDTNADGTLDGTETTMFAGVTVNLTDALGNIIATTTTDANGDYSFANIPVGIYTVSVEDVNDKLLGYWHSEGTDSEPSSTTVDASAGDVIDVDFGYYEESASLGNFVWNDANNNGIQDTGEIGIAGVDVTLEIDYDGDGSPEITLVETTDTNGFYSFDNLLLDEDYASNGTVVYTVSATAPTGFMSTITDVNTNGNDTEDSDDPAGVAATVTQGAATTTTNVDPTMEMAEATYDFGFFQTGTAVIGNTVWLDENGDGIQDAGEPGMAGVVVELKDGAGNVVATTTTDANGGYIFTDLPADTYTVTVLSGLPIGAVPTYDENGGTDQTTTVTVANGDEHMTADFGYNYTPVADTDAPTMTATGALGDRVWNDADGDGVQDAGESGIAGVTVTLYSDPDSDGVYDTVAGTTTTDATGNYIFDDLAPAAYVVEVNDTTLPAGFATIPTGDPDGDADNTSDPIIVAPGDVVLIGDFGYQPTASSTIGDLIFVDADGDGVQDAGEPGIPDVTVSLEDALGNVIATTTTDENGNYSFPGLSAGTYDVVITDTDNVLGDLTPISDPDGGMDLTSNVTVDGTTDALNEDFGFAPDNHTAGDGMIGSTIFLDTDNSNSLTAGEGVEGVTVELYAADGTTLLDTKVTDENGDYYFGALDPVTTYVVKVDEATLPGGDIYVNNVDPDGAAPGAGVSTSDLATVTDGIDLTKDFGYVAVTPNTISGTIWEDTNADGTLDGTEAVDYSGVTVDLLDVNGNILATTTTDASGNYSFANLPDGDYVIAVTDLAEVLADTWHSIGADSEPEQVAINVSGADVVGVDFGYYTQPAALGNRVWDDTNGDGIQDVGEAGLSGVVVTLEIDYDNDGMADVTVATVTDGSGFYSFDNLLLDEDYNGDGSGTEPIYTLSAAMPAGYMATVIDANSNANDMEDADDPTGVIATATQGAGDTSQKTDPTTETSEATFDFGFRLVPLPVTLTHFSGQASGCNTNLKWHAETEENFSHYEIERSGDGRLFSKIGTIKGTGGPVTGVWYTYIDKTASEFNYYRLKMVDLDGSFEYSKIINVDTDCSTDYKIELYPNPTSSNLGVVNVKFYSNSDEAQIQIVDMQGRTIKQLTIDTVREDVNLLQLDITDLPAGSYHLNMIGGGKASSKTFIITNE